jgi:siroheme synthase
VSGTVVLFMALANLAEIAERLIAHGRDPRTPAAVISAGSTPAQQAVTVRLADVAEEARGLQPPALVVIGHVVELAPVLGRRYETSAAA